MNKCVEIYKTIKSDFKNHISFLWQGPHAVQWKKKKFFAPSAGSFPDLTSSNVVCYKIFFKVLFLEFPLWHSG